MTWKEKVFEIEIELMNKMAEASAKRGMENCVRRFFNWGWREAYMTLGWVAYIESLGTSAQEHGSCFGSMFEQPTSLLFSDFGQITSLTPEK